MPQPAGQSAQVLAVQRSTPGRICSSGIRSGMSFSSRPPQPVRVTAAPAPSVPVFRKSRRPKVAVSCFTCSSLTARLRSAMAGGAVGRQARVAELRLLGAVTPDTEPHLEVHLPDQDIPAGD